LVAADRRGHLQALGRGASGTVYEQAVVRRVACATAQGAVDAATGANAGTRAVRSVIADIAFEAVDELSVLPVEAAEATAVEPIGTDAVARRLGVARKGPTCLDAAISARPTG